MTEQTKEILETTQDNQTTKTKSTSGRKKSVDTVDNSVVKANEKSDEKSVDTVDNFKKIGIYALHESVVDPSYGTEHSACFDIRVNLNGVYNQDTQSGTVKGMIPSNQPFDVKIEKDQEGKLYFTMRPHSRVLAPTAMILDIPVGYSVKVHPRSGTSFKEGINLINQEGVIDADYVEELFLPLVNTSDNYVKIYSGERYAQGELQVVEQVKFEKLKERPSHKTDRTGGFGSTGVK